MIVELLTVLAIVTGGCALVRGAGIRGWPLPALGYLAGVALYVSIGFLQVITPLPTYPALTIALTAGAPLAWWLTALLRGRDVTVPVPAAALGLVGAGAAVAGFRWLQLVNFHYDSFRYLMSSALLADNTFQTAVSINLVTKRLLAVPLLHAPAQLTGEYHLRSVFPMLAMATVAALVWLFREGVRAHTSTASLATFGTLGVLLLLSVNRFVFNAFYLNGHLLFAAMVLLVAGGGWLLASTDRVPARALMLLQLLAVPAVVVTRAEGPIVLLVALLPTLLSGRIPLRHRASVLGVLGASTVLWQAFILLIYRERGSEPPFAATGLLLLGAAVLVLIPLLWWRPLTRHATGLLWLAGAGLWAGMLVLAARRPAILRDSVGATVDNVVLGHGSWGASLVVLSGLVVAAVLLLRAPHAIHLHFPLTTFPPLVLILAYLREKAYRVGDYDSLNRMFIQLVPVAVLYLMVVAASGDWRIGSRRRRSHADRPVPGRGEAADSGGPAALRDPVRDQRAEPAPADPPERGDHHPGDGRRDPVPH